MTLACSSCRIAVLRKDCHRNRYGDYICRACQSAGVRHSLRARVRHGLRRSLQTAWIALALVLLVLLLGWIWYILFVGGDSSELFSWFD